MNKEYIRIDENLMVVYDERGCILHRNYTEIMPDVLVLENNLDYIGDIISKLKKELSDIHGSIYLTKLHEKLHLIGIIFLTVCALISTIVTGASIYFIYPIVFSVLTAIKRIGTVLLRDHYIKRKTGIEKQISVAEEICDKWAKELKSLSLTDVEDRVVIDKKYIVPMQSYEEENKKIEEAYEIGYNCCKGKVRTRKLEKK